jgi:hypothetical protein
VVSNGGGDRLTFKTVADVTWELTHASVFALAADLGTFSIGQGVGLVLANALMMVYLACAAYTRGQRGVHDFIAGTIVEPA